MLHVYTIEHDGRKVNVILLDRAIRTTQKAEAHSTRQYVVEQFNSAYMASAEYAEFLRAVEQLKAEQAGKRRKGLLELPDGFSPLEARQFNQLAITPGRQATPREYLWFLVLTLSRSAQALTPQSDWA